jgi:hypothetical protein
MQEFLNQAFRHVELGKNVAQQWTILIHQGEHALYQIVTAFVLKLPQT